jgi:hypothetical protein
MSDIEVASTPGKRRKPTNTLQPVMTETSLTPLALLQQAVAGGASIDILERLMGLQERFERNAARRAYDAAIAAAKADLPTILKSKKVGFDSRKPGAARTTYRHEDMAAIASAIDEPLGRHGLSYRFRTHNPPGEPITVTCIISHREGHSEENSLSGPPDDSGAKNKHQAIGSAVTYLSRYTLKAALGLAAADDDDAQATSADTAAINPEQLDELQQLIAHVGQDIGKFCAYFGIDKVADLRASDFADAKYNLELKKNPSKKEA